MIYIDQINSEFLHAKQLHYNSVRYVIKKKLLGKKFTEAHPSGLTQKIAQVTGVNSSVATFLNDEKNLKEILIGTPDILDQNKKRYCKYKVFNSI
jgi:hypothetical protein